MRPTKEHLCARIPPSASGLARTYLLRVSAGASHKTAIAQVSVQPVFIMPFGELMVWLA